MNGTKRFQQLFLVGLADDVDKRNLILQAEFDQHLAEVRRCSCVHQGRMPFATHGFQHSEGGQRIDEGRRPILRGCSVRQVKTRGGVDRSVLGVHAAAGDPHRLAEQGLGCCRRPCRDDSARRLVAHRKRLVDSRRKPFQGAFAQCRGDDGVFRRARHRCGGHVGAGNENAQVRRVDRRGFHADQHLIGGRGWNRDVVQ